MRRIVPLLAVCLSSFIPGSGMAAAPDQEEIAATAKAAYIYGYPMVDMYAILHSHVLDPKSPEFKAPLNQVGHVRNVATPDDRAVIAPNVDTPYSHAWLDLRTEPVVISLPAFEPERYVSLQLSDLYTWIVGYVTPRTNGHEGGDFLVAGPDWQGETPPGIKKVFRSTTQLALALFRTQLLDPADLNKVHALQDRFQVRPLSMYLKRPAPQPQPIGDPVTPVNLRQTPATPEFLAVLNWMLRFMPALPEEAALRERLVRIGVLPGAPFQPADEATRGALVRGMHAGLDEMGARAGRVTSSAELFGSRDQLRDDYLIRATAAMLGILGNSAEEFLGVGYQADANGQPFHGKRRYRIKFAADGLPPVDAFWSITVYTQERLLYDNPVQRYVINTASLPGLKKDDDGGFTIYIQHESPGADEANWLPVPASSFGLTFRTYLPGEAIRNGTWRAPPVVPVD